MNAYRYIPETNNNPNFLKKLTPKLQTTILATKSKSWSYEEEARIIRSKAGPLTIDPSFIAGICFGLNTKEDQIRHVIRRAEQGGLKCSYFRSIRDQTDFGLSIIGLDDQPILDTNLESRVSGLKKNADLCELIKRDIVRNYLSVRL
jgi:hypothetical protein